jgi:hypothetical protein
MTNTWPTNWTRIPTLSLRNAALRNAEAAAAECARRRRDREETEAYLLLVTQRAHEVEPSVLRGV